MSWFLGRMVTALAFVLSCMAPALADSTVPASTLRKCEDDNVAIARAALQQTRSALADLLQDLHQLDDRTRREIAVWIGVTDTVGVRKTMDILGHAIKRADRVVFVCSADERAKVFPADANLIGNLIITLSPYFFEAPEDRYFSRAGVLVHDLVLHSIAGNYRQEVILTPEQSKQRAINDPFIAGITAESYSYLIESRLYGLQ